MVKTVAYCRTSKNSQTAGLEVQKEALSRFKVDKWYIEQVSGRREDRQELNNALKILEEGDTLITYKIDRLGRSTKQLVNIMAALKEKKINVIFVKENIDTSTNIGQMVFTIMASIAELEASFISERTKEALAVVRKNGTKLGNQGLSKNKEKKIVNKLVKGNLTYKQIALQCEVCEKTVYNVKKRNNL